MRLIIRKKGKNGLNISRWNILFASFRYFSNKNRIQFPLNGAIFYISSSFIIDLVVARMENTSSPFRVIFRKIIQFLSYLCDYFFNSPKIFPISLLFFFFIKISFSYPLDSKIFKRPQFYSFQLFHQFCELPFHLSNFNKINTR